MDNLYGGEGVLPVVLVTGVLGGGAAWLTGRAIAHAWRPPWQVVVAALFLGAAARFIHFALFGGKLFSIVSYGVDTVIFVAVGLAAFRAARAGQMVRQYPWLYARAGPLGWREIGHQNES